MVKAVKASERNPISRTQLVESASLLVADVDHAEASLRRLAGRGGSGGDDQAPEAGTIQTHQAHPRQKDRTLSVSNSERGTLPRTIKILGTKLDCSLGEN